MQQLAAITGLVMNLFGVLILFRFGMPFRTETEGHTFIVMEGVDSQSIEKDNLYKWLGYLGILLIVDGTLLQILAVLTGFAPAS